MKAKLFYWLSGTIGGLFLLALFLLKTFDKVQWGGFIFFIIIIIILVIGVDLVTWLTKVRNKKTVNTVVEKNKLVTLEDARQVFKKELMSTQYSEYERDVLSEGVVQMGSANTPVYVKLIRGEFEGQLHGGVVNMLDPVRKAFATYPDSMKIEDIYTDLEKKSNLVSFAPSPEIQKKVTESYDALTGRSVVHTEPLPALPEEKTEKGELG